MSARLRRSCLFMPAANERALAKATTLDCDAVLFDLEDAVAPEAKPIARERVTAALARHDYGRRERILRVNALDTPWGFEDLQLAARLPIDAVLLPKVEAPRQLRDAATALEGAGRGGLPLWVMIETPRGVLNADRIMAAAPAPAVLVIGTNDLGRELRLPPDAGREAFAWTFGHCVMAARAHGADVLDGVHNRIGDPEGLAAACQQARALGFDGKTLIHPGQIEIANAVFSPTAEELQEARALLAAWDEAQRAGVGVVTFRDRMIEALHANAARRVLELHGNIGSPADR